jgi:ketosteroid isomerase-like protein
MSTEDEVHNASEIFYAALSQMANGDSGALATIWSNSPGVTIMHPRGGREVGWDAVGASLEQVAILSSEGTVGLKDQVIRVAGDFAYELGVEHGHLTLAGHHVTFEHRVTNIYEREAGAWKVVHHHADLSPALIDVVSRLKK